VRGCCGTADRPRVAVLSCAGAYVAGAAGSNECPAGSARIEAEAACRTAAAAAGKTVPESYFVQTASYTPRGCYFFTSNNYAYFNRDLVGAGNSASRLLCAVITGSPFAPHADARMLAPTRK
jgi:hypothetical protein